MDGKTIIVTGANGGMGQATVETLLDVGAKVVGCDLHVDQLEKFMPNERFYAVAGNLIDEAPVQGAFQTAKDRFGSVDGLVNILGIAQQATPIEDVTVDDYYDIIDTNMTTIFLTCREAAKYMKKQQSGKIVNVGSVATTRPRPGLQAYVASKGAVESFSKALALELAPDKINVNILHPGPANTTMLGEFTEEGGNVDATKKEIFEKSVPLGRLIEPKDIASSIKYLLSDDAAMVTGTILHVDGGRNI